MTLNITGLPDTTSAAPQVRAVAQTVSAPGVNDAAALARQQTVNAAPAPTILAAYAANIASPPKPALRNPPAVSSSTFAAQYIAQTPDATQEDLQMFAVAQQPQEPTEEAEAGDDFLAQLRLARGDAPETPSTAASSTLRTPVAANSNAPAAQTSAANPVVKAPPAPPPAQQGSSVTSSTFATIAASLPGIALRNGPSLVPSSIGVPLTHAGPTRKQTLSTTRGTDAYQLTESRIGSTRSNETLATVF